ncbi:alkaline phosphatase [Anaerosphaera multitolerans]|uniref:Alkaline phosphatase n=1 Tax=Anaerosphaera multitolerans TaxID=2487351 RepID=A0A437S9W8_9FIRM|nr:alkaline phosphatase [Anaerosphaera multitolerans]RVU55671.1 alkaline phosphatase [Anaerosphaera multitolerans]
MKFSKKLSVIALSAVLLLPSNVFAKTEDYGSAKNVIVMIPDGMNIESLTTSRWMSDDFSLTLDSMATGLVRTNNANTPIADSAPAGTAMATGVKTESPFVGTYPSSASMPGAETFEEKRSKMPIANVLEGAKRLEKSTGIISTSNIQHATPADFSAHHINRNAMEELAEQQVYQDMDVVLGAGSKYLEKENRKDGEDLIAELKTLGYDYITTPTELKNSTSDKIWGMFGETELSYDIDRNPEEEPSLAEMTEKALEVLSKNDKGFFLMVEGSKIDWAAHANDPVGIKSDVLSFDKAVKVAKEFADKNKDTVIIAAADHGTGGMTFGNNTIAKGYDKAPLEEFTKHIKSAKFTGQEFENKLNAEKSNVKELMAEGYGIEDLTEEEINSVKTAKDVQAAVGKIVSSRSNIGWTTGGHVGGDVALYCYSTAEGAEVLSGTVHNAEIGKYVEDLFDMDLKKLTDELYIPAREGFESKGATVDYVMESKGNAELVVTKDTTTLRFPMYKNYAIVGDKEVELNGLVIHNGDKVYVPQSAIDLIK